MTVFTITSENDPFLHVTLQQGEGISCESGAMVMMESTLELSGKMQGGLVNALARKLANGESFFQQHIKAVRGQGDCLLAPTFPGAIEVLNVGKVQYKIADGAYLASDEGVQVTAQMQGLGNAILGNNGGFFIGQSSGTGKLAVCGYGTLFTLDVTPNNPMTVDNGHVVAWDSQLSYQISVATGQNRGLLGNIVNSVTSGEGVVLQFSGTGKVILCSRNMSHS